MANCIAGELQGSRISFHLITSFSEAMAKPLGKSLSATPPADTYHGAHNSLFMVMSDLSDSPVTGRLLRGLTPFLDEQGAEHVFLLAERRRTEPWSDSERLCSYRELVHWHRGGGEGVYRGVSTKDAKLTPEAVIGKFGEDPLGLIDWPHRKPGPRSYRRGNPCGWTSITWKNPGGGKGGTQASNNGASPGCNPPRARPNSPMPWGCFPCR